jgi:hypothetical protein
MYPQKLGCFCNFQKATQSKQLPNGREFPKSGHPVRHQRFYTKKTFSLLSSQQLAIESKTK